LTRYSIGVAEERKPMAVNVPDTGGHVTAEPALHLEVSLVKG
jgi:hypothetical protein